MGGRFVTEIDSGGADDRGYLPSYFHGNERSGGRAFAELPGHVLAPAHDAAFADDGACVVVTESANPRLNVTGVAASSFDAMRSTAPSSAARERPRLSVFLRRIHFR